MSTKIEWTDETWNPIRGCSRVSEGCWHCYAEAVAYRFSGPGQPYEGLVQLAMVAGKDDVRTQRLPLWNGQIKFVEEHLLDPLKWKPGRPIYDATTGKSVGRDKAQSLRIFVNSMSDLFHENVTDEMRDRIFAVMALCPQHTFQVLTKRPEQMLAYLAMLVGGKRKVAIRGAEILTGEKDSDSRRFCEAHDRMLGMMARWSPGPLPNVWLGVSVENQATADERIPLLLQTPAAVRFISAEPLLGPVDLRTLNGMTWFLKWMAKTDPHAAMRNINDANYPQSCPWDSLTGSCLAVAPGDQTKLDWVICGGESGTGARPMHPDWARSLRDQCDAAGVPFFFKQWGEWGWEGPIRWSATPEMAGQCYGPFRPTCGGPGSDKRMMCRAYPAVIPGELGKDDRCFVMLQEARRVGKKAAGHALDGKVWQQFPAPAAEKGTA